MANSKKSEKSKGVVVFAFNTKFDYVGIADRTSQLIKHKLGLPVTLITDPDSQPTFNYDHIIRVDNQGGTIRLDNSLEEINWRNFGRYLAYKLSPYEETILLDTDYVVLDDSLLQLFKTDFDYKLIHHNTTPDGPSYESMGETSLPYVWATVVLFRKTERAELFFNLIGRIQRNYGYYRSLYNIREGNYRNDYAFAIANSILSGYTLNEEQGIPWNLFTITDPISNIEYTEHFLKVRQDSRAIVVPHQCIHIMDKNYLLSDNFKELVEVVCES
jgi:hypothetical protein